MVQDHVTGCLVNLDDHEGAASKILNLIDDSHYAIRLTRAARKELHKYTWETVGTKWKSLYRQLAVPFEDDSASTNASTNA